MLFRSQVINKNNKYVEAVKNLKQYLPRKNLTILCADTHLYQHDLITIDDLTINQYIAGTGGASLDDSNPIKLLTMDDGSINIQESIKAHGFLVCEIQANSPINCKFIISYVPEKTVNAASAATTAAESNMAGGRRTKNHRHRKSKRNTKKKVIMF